MIVCFFFAKIRNSKECGKEYEKKVVPLQKIENISHKKRKR
jgi:hypothetical protein